MSASGHNRRLEREGEIVGGGKPQGQSKDHGIRKQVGGSRPRRGRRCRPEGPRLKTGIRVEVVRGEQEGANVARDPAEERRGDPRDGGEIQKVHRKGQKRH